MTFEPTLTWGNVFTVIAVVISWLATLFAVNSKNRQRAEKLHADNQGRFTALEQDLKVLQGQVAMLVDFFTNKLERRGPR